MTIILGWEGELMVKAIVLIIDDQPGIRRLLVEVLEEEGYLVVEAEDGLDGVKKAQEHNPDLILMDMKMPGMDGLETLGQLKKLGLSAQVIMMTAYGELDMVTAAKAIGAVEFITKPFDITVLCQIIRNILATA
jgi:two-component system response regulator (stage 0 sporulation protein F)